MPVFANFFHALLAVGSFLPPLLDFYQSEKWRHHPPGIDLVSGNGSWPSYHEQQEAGVAAQQQPILRPTPTVVFVTITTVQPPSAIVAPKVAAVTVIDVASNSAPGRAADSLAVTPGFLGFLVVLLATLLSPFVFVGLVLTSFSVDTFVQATSFSLVDMVLARQVERYFIVNLVLAQVQNHVGAVTFWSCLAAPFLLEMMITKVSPLVMHTSRKVDDLCSRVDHNEWLFFSVQKWMIDMVRGLSAQVKILRANHQLLRTNHNSLRTNHDSLRTGHDSLRSRIDDIDTRLGQDQLRDGVVDDRLTMLEGTAEGDAIRVSGFFKWVRDNLQDLGNKLMALRGDHNTLQRNYDTLNENHVTLYDDFNELAEKHHALDIKHDELQDDHDIISREHPHMRERLDRLEEYVVYIGNEYAKLKTNHANLSTKHEVMYKEMAGHVWTYLELSRLRNNETKEKLTELSEELKTVRGQYKAICAVRKREHEEFHTLKKLVDGMRLSGAFSNNSVAAGPSVFDRLGGTTNLPSSTPALPESAATASGSTASAAPKELNFDNIPAEQSSNATNVESMIATPASTFKFDTTSTDFGGAFNFGMPTAGTSTASYKGKGKAPVESSNTFDFGTTSTASSGASNPGQGPATSSKAFEFGTSNSGPCTASNSSKAPADTSSTSDLGAVPEVSPGKFSFNTSSKASSSSNVNLGPGPEAAASGFTFNAAPKDSSSTFVFGPGPEASSGSVNFTTAPKTSSGTFDFGTAPEASSAFFTFNAAPTAPRDNRDLYKSPTASLRASMAPLDNMDLYEDPPASSSATESESEADDDEYSATASSVGSHGGST